MQLAYLHDFCLTLPGAEDTLPFGPDTLVYKVMNKMFLITGVDDTVVSINVKCDPTKAIELREQYSYVQPGYHMNKKHWNTVLMDGTVNVTLLKQWITDSYNLVVTSLTKSQQTELAKLYKQ